MQAQRKQNDTFQILKNKQTKKDSNQEYYIQQTYPSEQKERDQQLV